MDADKIANELYLESGRSKKDIAVGWLEIFSNANTELNEKRYAEISKMLLDAQAAEMKGLLRSKSKKNKNTLNHEIKSRATKANNRKGNRERKK